MYLLFVFAGNTPASDLYNMLFREANIIREVASLGYGPKCKGLVHMDDCSGLLFPYATVQSEYCQLSFKNCLLTMIMVSSMIIYI